MGIADLIDTWRAAEADAARTEALIRTALQRYQHSPGSRTREALVCAMAERRRARAAVQQVMRAVQSSALAG